MRLQCRVGNLAAYLRSAARLAVLCRPALIQAAPSACFLGKNFQGKSFLGKSVTLSAWRGGEEG
jgi:hypothetical protein